MTVFKRLSDGKEIVDMKDRDLSWVLANNEGEWTDLTETTIQQVEASEAASQQARLDAEAARISASSKLKALGLTDSEIKALTS